MPKLNSDTLAYIPSMVKPEHIDLKGEFKARGFPQKIAGKNYVECGVLGVGGGGAAILLQNISSGKACVQKQIFGNKDAAKAEYDVLHALGKVQGEFLEKEENRDSYQFHLMTAETKMEKGQIYVREVKKDEKTILAYSMITMNGSIVEDIPMNGVKFTPPLTQETFSPKEKDEKAVKQSSYLKSDIMDVIEGNKHKIADGMPMCSFIIDLERGSDLHKDIVLKQKKPLPPSRASLLSMAFQAVSEVKSLHDKNLVHCDIKPHNFMWDEANKKLALIDFGETQVLDEKKIGKREVFVESPGYCAPELKEKNGDFFHYTPATDVYALGKSLLAMLMIESVPDVKSAHTTPFKYDITLQKLLYEMVDEDPDKRPSLESVEQLLAEYQEESLQIEQESVAIVDIRELAHYWHSPDKEKKQQYLAALGSMDAMLMVDNAESKFPPLNKRDIQILKLELGREGIAVKDQLFYAPNAQAFADIPESFNPPEKEKVVRAYINVSIAPPIKTPEMIKNGIGHLAVTHGDPQKYKQEVKTHLSEQKIPVSVHAKVKDFLQDEVARLQQRKDSTSGKSAQEILTKRIHAITRQISVMDSHKSQLTYGSINNMFAVLETKMNAASGLHKFFGIKSEGAKKFQFFNQQIKQEAHQPVSADEPPVSPIKKKM